MTENTINWSDLKKMADKGTKPAPEGKYIGEVSDATAETSSTGKPQYRMKITIIDGEYVGKTLLHSETLTLDKAWSMHIFFSHMAALGMDDAFFAKSPTHEQVAAALNGRRGVFSLTIEEYQGRKNNKVANIEPLPPGTVIRTPSASPSASPSTTPGVPNTPSTPNGAVSRGSTPGVPSVPSTPSVPSVSAPATPAPATPFD